MTELFVGETAMSQRRLLKVLSAVFICAALFPELAACQPRLRKKVVEYGWDVPYPDFVRDNIGEMERQPFDGIILRTKGFDHVFDVRPWDSNELQPQLDTLAQIKWDRFTDNFLTLYAANKQNMDWFNDDHWNTIAENMKLFSRAVQAGHCVGVCFDPEPYGTDPWVYSGSNDGKSFDKVVEQVRKRGRQFIRALETNMPKLRVLSFFQFGLYSGILDEPDPNVRKEKLLGKQWMVLLPAFYIGILEGASPDTILIDGNESAYYYESSESFFRAYHTIRQRAQSLVPEDLRQKYNAQVQAGMALYIDQALATRTQSTTSHFMSSQEQLRFFEHNAYYALTTTDEYVWCYSEKMNWWSTSETARYPGLPEGVRESLISARKKYEQGAPLGFEIDEMISKARKNRNNSK